MHYDSCRSLPAMFFAQAERLGEKPFLWAKRDGRFSSLSWAAAAQHVRRLALGLRSLGIGSGERVALVSENRPEWIIADLAIMTAGAITVPAYVTHTVEDHRHLFANSGARAVFVSKPALSARVLAAANQVDTVHSVIAIEPAAGQASTVDLLSWDEMLARGINLHGDRLRDVSDATTVQVRNREVLVSDGPFAETKEQIAGYDVIECADLDEAIEIAAKHPTAWLGTIEVRPIQDDPCGSP